MAVPVSSSPVSGCRGDYPRTTESSLGETSSEETERASLTGREL
jgi:hypothetical protein